MSDPQHPTPVISPVRKEIIEFMEGHPAVQALENLINDLHRASKHDLTVSIEDMTFDDDNLADVELNITTRNGCTLGTVQYEWSDGGFTQNHSALELRT